MIRNIFAFFLLALPLLANSPKTDPSKVNKPETVRILISKLAKECKVEIEGAYHIYNPYTDEWIESGAKDKRAKMTASDKGISWGKTLVGSSEVRIVPAERSSSISIDGCRYPGCVEIYGIGGTLNIINEVDTENYLIALLSPLFKAPKLPAVLDALAIVERTNLYHSIARDAYATWQLDASIVGYQGIKRQDVDIHVKESVERTRGQILNYQKRPFHASWSINHAGKSAPFSSIFRKADNGPAGATKLPSSQIRSRSVWNSSVPIKTLLRLTNLKRLDRLELFRERKSGKIYALRFTGDGRKVDIDFFTLQKELGNKMFKSNDFISRIKGKKVYFQGYGLGHGVGLCLQSAEILAQQQKTVQEILIHHFPETELIDLKLTSGKPQNTNPIWN